MNDYLNTLINAIDQQRIEQEPFMADAMDILHDGLQEAKDKGCFDSADKLELEISWVQNRLNDAIRQCYSINSFDVSKLKGLQLLIDHLNSILTLAIYEDQKT